MGADRAILIETDLKFSLSRHENTESHDFKETPQLVILGKQAIDSDNNQTGQVGRLIEWPQGHLLQK